MIINLFKTIKDCRHEKISSDVEKAYCPDCGMYVENKWYLARCSCCNIKRASYSSFNNIKPTSVYCPNCGTKEYYLEELHNINFIDINFAVVKKVEVAGQNVFSRSQVWVDEKESMPQKLLGILGV